jgi:hypothetical protein
MLLFQTFGSRGSGVKLCSGLSSDDILIHGEIRGEEYHEGRIWSTSNGVSGLFDVDGIAWCSGSRSSSMHVGATTQVKFRVLSFRVKRSCLNWLCLAMALLKALF